MITEPNKFYRARYSFDKGDALFDAAIAKFTASGHFIERIERSGPDLPAWLTVIFRTADQTEMLPGHDYGEGILLVSIEEEPLGPVTKWPGLETVAREDLLALKAAIPATWDFDSLLGHISSESPFFQLSTKNPYSTARGLIQMTAGNRAKYHAEDLSSFRAQIPGIVAYFKDATKPDLVGSDFKVAGFSQRSVHKPDSTIIWKAGAPETVRHQEFLDENGNFTVGSIRKWWDSWVTKVKSGKTKKRPIVTKKTLSLALGLGAAAALGLVLLLGMKKSR